MAQQQNFTLATRITQLSALYNASALVFFLLPGGLSWFGLEVPDSSFWRVLPALLAFYGAVVLFLASKNIEKYASFAFWNGIIRITFALAAFAADYLHTLGLFVFLLALGDFILGLLTLTIIKKQTGKSVGDLLFNH